MELSRGSRARCVTFNMHCFPGAVTSVDRGMDQDGCVETTLHYDTGLQDLKSSPDFGQAEVADETV